jgi:hypothetical protein
MPLYIGVDQSLSSSGIAIWTGPYLFSTRYESSPDLTTFERIHDISGVLRVLLELKPNCVTIESAPTCIMGGKKLSVKTLIQLNQLEFSLLSTLHSSPYGYKILTPRVKDSLGWPGILGADGTKEKAKSWMLSEGLSLDDKTVKDEIDAIGLLWASLKVDELPQAHDFNPIHIRIAPREFRTNLPHLNGLLLETWGVQKVPNPVSAGLR